MRYSVWNTSTRLFDYYDSASTPLTTNAAKPGHMVSRTLGATVEQAAWPLPSDAVPAGSGDAAMGMVAATASTKRAAMAGVDLAGGGLATLALIGAGAVAAYLIFGRRS